jgi:AraC family transcriptional activator of tynA and feaB
MAIRLSTDDVAEKDRFSYWQDVLYRAIGKFELTSRSRARFDAHLDVSPVGDLHVANFTGSSQTLRRTKSMIRSGDADNYVLLLESSKTFVIDHNGHQRSGHGGMVLVDIARPRCASHPDGADFIDICIPRQVMERALGPARRAAGLALDPKQPMFPVISSFLRTMCAQAKSLDPASATRMSNIAIDLIATGFAERIAHSQPMSGAALLLRAQSYINDNLGVAGLSVRDVAAALQVSPRRLHQAATDEGISLVEWMWERRLARARAMLTAPESSSMPIAIVGYQCGFVDQAHFSRRFKQRFDESPRDHRLAAGDARAGAGKLGP